MRWNKMMAPCVATLVVAGASTAALGLTGTGTVAGGSADMLPASAIGTHIWQTPVLATERLSSGGVFDPKTGLLVLTGIVTKSPGIPVGGIAVSFLVGNQSCQGTSVLGVAICTVNLGGGPPPAGFVVSAAGTTKLVGVSQTGPIITVPSKPPKI